MNTISTDLFHFKRIGIKSNSSLSDFIALVEGRKGKIYQKQAESLVKKMILYWIILTLTGLILVSIFYVCRQEFRKDRVPILLYHRLRPKNVGVDDFERIFVVYVSRFEEQMNYLATHGYNVISLAQYVAYVEGKDKLPEKPIIITFDDGYLSNYQYAYPILQKYGFPATIFITVDENSKVFKDREKFDSPLTKEQIKEISENNISIQSHAITHNHLSDLPDKETEYELAQSKVILEKLTGKPVDFLAIPGAFYSKKVKQIAKEVGYKAAFSGHKGTNSSASDLYSLRRIVIERDSNLKDFEKSLKPLTACQWRIVGWLKSLPTLFLGTHAGSKLRKKLYHTKLGYFLTFRVFRFVLLLGAVILIIFMVFIWWIAK